MQASNDGDNRKVAIRRSHVLVRCGGCRQPMLRSDGRRFYPKNLTYFGPGNHAPLIVRGQCMNCQESWRYDGDWPDVHNSE